MSGPLLGSAFSCRGGDLEGGDGQPAGGTMAGESHVVGGSPGVGAAGAPSQIGGAGRIGEAGSAAAAGDDGGAGASAGGEAGAAGAGGQPYLGTGGDAAGAGGVAEGAGGETATPRAIAVAAGNFHSCAVLVDGTARCWGANYLAQLGNGTTGPSICANNAAMIGCAMTPVEVSGLDRVEQISLGNHHSCALRSDGSITCWGLNEDGQLGLGGVDGPDACSGTDYSLACSLTPADVTGIEQVISLSAADESHTCAVATEGTTLCWGLTAGQYAGVEADLSTCPHGDFELDCAPSPLEIPDVGGAVAVDSATFHTCALLTDETVSCWGFGISGELGNGTTSGGGSAPVSVSSLTGVKAIATGGSHSCALRADKSVWCWGSNNVGQLGVGSTEGPSICEGPTLPPFDIPCAKTPVKVANLTEAVAIASGGRHSCALLADRTVACWGANENGQLGIGSTGPMGCTAGFAGTAVPCAQSPVLVPNLRDVVGIATGALHTCAALADGSVACWGYNVFGQLGIGNTTDAYAPTLVAW
jgi:alpha-tubulin suppressor-like RCC1 family protein